MDLRTESLETLLQGGIAFDTPQTLESGQPAEEGTVFAL
jgi:paraquat-inducible protein B